MSGCPQVWTSGHFSEMASHRRNDRSPINHALCFRITSSQYKAIPDAPTGWLAAATLMRVAGDAGGQRGSGRAYKSLDDLSGRGQSYERGYTSPIGGFMENKIQWTMCKPQNTQTKLNVYHQNIPASMRL